MEFSRQEYWSGLPFPFPGDLPDPGIKRRSPTLQADSLLTGPPWKMQLDICWMNQPDSFKKDNFRCSIDTRLNERDQLGGYCRNKSKKITVSWIRVVAVQFSCSVVSNSGTHGLHHTKLPCPSPTPWAYSNSCPLSWWCHPFHPLSSPSPPDFNLSQHQGLFRWVSSSHQVDKILEFQLQHQSFQWIFRTYFL